MVKFFLFNGDFILGFKDYAVNMIELVIGELDI